LYNIKFNNIPDPYSREGDLEKFFAALGSGDMDSVANDSEDDEVHNNILLSV
jgi:hypothetical protein